MGKYFAGVVAISLGKRNLAPHARTLVKLEVLNVIEIMNELRGLGDLVRCKISLSAQSEFKVLILFSSLFPLAAMIRVAPNFQITRRRP